MKASKALRWALGLVGGVSVIYAIDGGFKEAGSSTKCDGVCSAARMAVRCGALCCARGLEPLYRFPAFK